jgi:hypothetical protein
MIAVLKVVSMVRFLLLTLCLFSLLSAQQCYGLNLSPVESALLKSRLDQIQVSVKQEYTSLLSENKNSSDNNKKEEEELDTFIFPGAGGVDDLVLELQSVTPNSKIIDWSAHRGSIATAAYDGEAVGEAIADLLVDSTNRNRGSSLHFIGISVGAFCANAAATITYQRDSSSKNVNVRLTLLDPFCGRGLFGSNYGKEEFGKYATTAVQIVNTDDPVPTTNDPLPNCYCIDVTDAPERDTFVLLPGDSMHSWPLAYFARHYMEPTTPLDRGCVIRIEK